MASIRDTIREQLAEASVSISETSLDTLLIDADMGEGTESYTKAHSAPVKKLLLEKLSKILVMPDQKIGDASITFDRTAVATYCNTLRGELGLTSVEGGVRNRSRIW